MSVYFHEYDILCDESHSFLLSWVRGWTARLGRQITTNLYSLYLCDFLQHFRADEKVGKWCRKSGERNHATTVSDQSAVHMTRRKCTDDAYDCAYGLAMQMLMTIAECVCHRVMATQLKDVA